MSPLSFVTVALLLVAGFTAHVSASRFDHLDAFEACAQFKYYTFERPGTFFAESRCALHCAFYTDNTEKSLQKLTYQLDEGMPCPLNKSGICKKGVCVVPKDGPAH